MTPSRRAVLGALGGALAGGLAGCTTERTETVDLAVSNATDRERSLYVEVLPADVEEDLEDSELFSAWVDLGPADTERSYRQLGATFEEQRALVRVRDGRGYLGEYTFVPDCPDGEEPGEAVEVALVSPGTVRFRQNWCR